MLVSRVLYTYPMPNYRRVKIKGGTYFFTIVTNKRQRIFHSHKARELLLKAFNHSMQFHPFTMEAYCILPDHIHLLWKMPEDDHDYSTRIAEIKKRFSKTYLLETGNEISKNTSQANRGESGLWQRRFWEHYIYDEEDLHRHIDYIHFNPVKHGLVKQVKDWPSSSFFDYVKLGYYEIDWGEFYEESKENLFEE